MLITYLIVLVSAIVFKILHWPGAGILFVGSTIFPFIDLIVQLIRNRSDKETRIWSAVCLIFLSLYLTFKFLNWPGAILPFGLAMLFSAIFLIRSIQKKHTNSFRFYALSALIAFSVFNSTLKGSAFKLFYMTEDPFDRSQPVPHFFIQRLAFDFYNEGDFKKSELLIQRNIDHLEKLLQSTQTEELYKDIDERNLVQSQDDLKRIQQRNWDIFIPLIPEDRPE